MAAALPIDAAAVLGAPSQAALKSVGRVPTSTSQDRFPVLFTPSPRYSNDSKYPHGWPPSTTLDSPGTACARTPSRDFIM